MNKRLYGIKKLFYAHEVVLPFVDVFSFRDNEAVASSNDWTELVLSRPGMISYEFKDVNNCIECNTTLECELKCDFVLDNRVCFFKAVTVDGDAFLVGLGNKYFSVPVSEFVSSVSDSASTANANHLKVSWINNCGRIRSV